MNSTNEIPQSVHLIGINGAGMSALANCLHQLGKIVSGSDLVLSKTTDELSSSGISIHRGHSSRNIGNAKLVVTSNAIPNSNIELNEARSRGIPIITRAECLSLLANQQSSVMVAGSHGKTTVAAMIAWILRSAGKNPSFAIGESASTLNSQKSYIGNGEHFVMEACEAFRNLHYLHPAYAVITNIDHEHLNHYGSQKTLDDAFLRFANFANKQVILNGDDAGIARILCEIKAPVISFGLSNSNTIFASNYVFDINGASFDLFVRGQFISKVALAIPGNHALMNALASIACAASLNIDLALVCKSISEFTGVKRRWEVYQNKNQFTLIDDYAHHPSEIAAIADTALGLRLPHQRLVIAFQPQLYSRTKLLLKEFGQQLARFDKVLLLDIDGAGEKDVNDISSDELAKEILSLSGDVEQFSDINDLLLSAPEILRPTDFLITAGTGQFSALAAQLSSQDLIKTENFSPQADYLISNAEVSTADIYSQTVISLFIKQLTDHPNSWALSEDGMQLSYGQLHSISNHIAAKLLEKGFRLGDVFAVNMRPCMEAVILLVSITKLGGVYLPIDLSTPVERTQYMLDTTNARWIITRQSGLKAEYVLSFSDLYTFSDAQFRVLDFDLLPSVANSDIAYICFTSGTTGKPKAIPITHGALFNFVEGVRDQLFIQSDTKTLLHTTLSFDVSLGEIWLTLCGGGELCSTGRSRPLLGGYLGRFIQTNKITHLLATPTILKTIPPDQYLDLTCIAMVGEKCPQDLVDAWANNRAFFNAYGPTEATIYTTIARCYPNNRVTIGLPIPNVSTHIFNENLIPIPQGEVGELYIGGLGLSKGYINLPSESALRFIQYSGQTLYRTGDMARYLPNGEIEYVGRMDNQVKILGNRIELEEIEQVISHFPEINDSVVLLDEQENDKSLICFAVLNKEYSFDWIIFREKLSKWLPSYMIPKKLIPINQILLTPNGKKNRNGLLSQYRHHIFERTDFTPPRTVTERDLEKIWRQFLKLTTDIGMYEDFAAMGGDSLNALELLTEVEQSFGITFPPEQLGGITNISKMAVVIEEIRWNSLYKQNYAPDNFQSSRIYKGLRHLTANWQGKRLYPDSLILQASENIGAEFQVFICIQDEGEFINIALSLGKDFQVYGMRSGHLLTDYKTADTDSLCKHYINEMLKIGLKKKLIIGGICQGGKIACRITEMLREMGVSTELIVLIDQSHLPLVEENIAFFYSEDSKINPLKHRNADLSMYKKRYGNRYQVYIIPGSHAEIHLEPQVHLLSDKLKRYLGLAEEDKNLMGNLHEEPDILLTNQANIIEKSGLFNLDFYRKQFPEGYKHRSSLAYHYLSDGWHQGYDPCVFFSTSGYLSRNPDVKQMGINPLIHFLHFGITQGREAWTEQDVIEWQRDWLTVPGLAQKVIDEHRGKWPQLTATSRVNVFAHSCGHMVFKTFQDLLVQGFNAIGINCKKHDETPTSAECLTGNQENILNIIIAPHEFFYLPGSPDLDKIYWNNILILNSEQLPSVWFRKALPFLFKAPYVLDMNIQTAACLSQLGINARFLPVGQVSGHPIFAGNPEIDFESRDIDILWIGTNSERREKFITENRRIYKDRNVCIGLVNITHQTLRSDDPGCIDAEKFTALAQRSKILLNVHHFDTPYFEWQRLIHFGLMQGCCVVTETTTQQPGLIPGEHYFEADINDLTELVSWLLDDPVGKKMARTASVAGQTSAIQLFQLDQTLMDLFGIPKPKGII